MRVFLGADVRVYREAVAEALAREGGVAVVGGGPASDLAALRRAVAW